MSQFAQGFIEVKGYVAAIEAADAMAKAAEVRISCVHKVDGPRVCVICEGDVAACKAAVDAAVSICGPKDMVWSTNVIPRPAGEDGETYHLLDAINAAKAAKKKAKMEATAARRAPKAEPAKKVEN